MDHDVSFYYSSLFTFHILQIAYRKVRILQNDADKEVLRSAFCYYNCLYYVSMLLLTSPCESAPAQYKQPLSIGASRTFVLLSAYVHRHGQNK